MQEAGEMVFDQSNDVVCQVEANAVVYNRGFAMEVCVKHAAPLGQDKSLCRFGSVILSLCYKPYLHCLLTCQVLHAF